MTVIVSDTSPVRALANLGILSLLERLYNEIVVPPAVASELSNPPKGQAVVDLAELPYVRVRSPSDRSVVDRFRGDLDLGESEALALALELGADLILMDEAAGRSMVKQVGLTTTGVLGILLEARQFGFLDALSPLLDRLRSEYRFYLTTSVQAEVLRLAGESS